LISAGGEDIDDSRPKNNPNTRHLWEANVCEGYNYSNVVASERFNVAENEYTQCTLLTNAKDENDISDHRDMFPNVPSPDFVVLKESWPLVGRDCEAEMFAEVKGQFGVPTLIASYPVPMNGHVNTSVSDAMEVPNDLEFWDVFGTGKKDLEPEARRHMRTLFETEGDHLQSSSGPKELVSVVVHAMLGKSYISSS
jgi:hypothetical protein